MTQFIAVIGLDALDVPGCALISLSDASLSPNVDAWLQSLSGGRGALLLVHATWMTASELIDDVRAAMDAESDWTDLPLGRALKHVARLEGGLVCWYASDNDDLPVVYDIDRLMTALEEAAQRDPPELYVRFDVARSDEDGQTPLGDVS